MPDSASAEDVRYKFLEMLYIKAKSRSLTWIDRGNDSFETKVGEYMIHADYKKSSANDKYIIWVFSGTLELIATYRESNVIDISENKLDGLQSYSEMIEKIFRFAKGSSDSSELAKALEALSEIGT